MPHSKSGEAHRTQFIKKAGVFINRQLETPQLSDVNMISSDDVQLTYDIGRVLYRDIIFEADFIHTGGTQLVYNLNLFNTADAIFNGNDRIKMIQPIGVTFKINGGVVADSVNMLLQVQGGGGTSWEFIDETGFQAVGVGAFLSDVQPMRLQPLIPNGIDYLKTELDARTITSGDTVIAEPTTARLRLVSDGTNLAAGNQGFNCVIRIYY